MKNNKDTFIFILVVAIVIAFYFFFKGKEREYILKDYSYSDGRIVKASRSDGAGTYIKYCYMVEGVSYYNEFIPKNSAYDFCYDNFKLCDTLRFWVIYSNTKPSQSMIDLTSPITLGEDPKETRNINNFEH